MRITVLFFGVLSDVAGTGLKIYDDIKNTEILRMRIGDDFPEIIHYNFRISVNSEIISGECELGDGDEVALLPPFSGG